MHLSEKHNYPSKAQKFKEINTDSITGATFSSLILFFFPFSSSICSCSYSPIVIHPFSLLWQPGLLPAPASCGDITSYELHLQSQDQFLNGQSGMMAYACPAERLARIISVQIIKNHCFTEKTLICFSKSVTCQCPGEYLLGVTNTQIKELDNMISLSQSITTWCYPLALIYSAKKGECVLGWVLLLLFACI